MQQSLKGALVSLPPGFDDRYKVLWIVDEVLGFLTQRDASIDMHLVIFVLLPPQGEPKPLLNLLLYVFPPCLSRNVQG
jgi:hypothetical protein